jgi:two-component system alkaline phosphatase synthesis response regulator PhoP
MKKILLIEDEKILREMYIKKLSEVDFRVEEAREAEEGLLYLKKSLPDLVILDILLPRKDGIFFLKKIRENPKTKDLPVIILSNLDDKETKQRAQKLGVKDYLIKTDYTPWQLVNKIKEFSKKL